MYTINLNFKEYIGLVQEICRQISLSNWRPDYVVGISRGGLLPAVMISHYFKVPMKPLQVSLRDGGDCVSDWGIAKEAFGYISSNDISTYKSRWDISKRKNILIVDDINDTGNTLNWIVNDWPSSCLPDQEYAWASVWNRNIKFAVIVDNLGSKFSKKIDFSAMEINKNEKDIWINFPYEEWWKVF